MQDFNGYRKNYNYTSLSENQLLEDPIAQFRQWITEVEAFGGISEINAMNIATIGLDGFPKNRIVLLKSYDYRGFVFYTNYLSEKGKALEKNPHICASFFWPNTERQVIIKGIVEKVSPNQSDGYFESRPRGSQLGAVVSPQSEPISSAAFLEEALENVEKKYENKPIPRPSHWGGYRILPKSIEFWQGRPNRLHDRICYYLQDDFSWNIKRLAP